MGLYTIGVLPARHQCHLCHLKGVLQTPFVATKKLGSGTEPGLSSVYELVTKAEGKVNARSSLGDGTTIEVLLPLVDYEESELAEIVREETAQLVDAKVYY